MGYIFEHSLSLRTRRRRIHATPFKAPDIGQLALKTNLSSVSERRLAKRYPRSKGMEQIESINFTAGTKLQFGGRIWLIRGALSIIAIGYFAIGLRRWG